MRKPDLFIVGAPRCGTTAMFDYLKAHPQIGMSSYKEPHYFGADLRGERFEMYRGHLEGYLALFKARPEHRRVGEGSVGYLFSKTAAQEIRDFNPNARIIVMLRNPVDALYSMYSQARYTGSTHYDTFEAMMADHDEVPPDQLVETSRRLLSLEGVRYAGQVQRYLETFDRDAVFISLYDDFRQNTPAVYLDTLRFLDVDETFAPEEFKVVNARKTSRNPLLSYLMQNHFLINIGVKVPELALPVYRWIKVINAGKATRETIDPVLHRELVQALHDDIQQLSQLIDRDLSHWMEANNA